MYKYRGIFFLKIQDKDREEYPKNEIHVGVYDGEGERGGLGVPAVTLIM
jgi:hypothetical protein